MACCSYEIRVVMVGKTGCGKSSLGNSILKKEKTKYFESKVSARAVTKGCQRGFRDLEDGRHLMVIDTPGLFDTVKPNEEGIKEITKWIALSSPGPHIFLFVLSITRLTKEEIDTFELLKKMFGPEVMNYVIVVFTRKDQLDDENGTIDDFVTTCPNNVRNLLAECKNRYVAICNKVYDPSHESDVADVINLILKTIDKNAQDFFSQELFEEIEKILKREEERRMKEEAIEAAVARERIRQEKEKSEHQLECHQLKIREMAKKYQQEIRLRQEMEKSEMKKKYQQEIEMKSLSSHIFLYFRRETRKLVSDEIRVVMVGKSGCGISCLGNSILKTEKTKYFFSKASVASVTNECKRGFRELEDGRCLMVIDTPGLFHTSKPNEECIKEITKCIAWSSPGPHIFLFVLSIRRFTQEEIETFEILKKAFGPKVMNYVIVVFTGKDHLDDEYETIDDFVRESPLYLRDLLAECKNRYVAICNKVRDPSHESDVADVMNLIFQTIANNHQEFFSQEMFERS